MLWYFILLVDFGHRRLRGRSVITSRAKCSGLRCLGAVLSLPILTDVWPQLLFRSPGLILAFIQLYVLHIHRDMSRDVRDLEPAVACHVYGLINGVM